MAERFNWTLFVETTVLPTVSLMKDEESSHEELAASEPVKLEP